MRDLGAISVAEIVIRCHSMARALPDARGAGWKCVTLLHFHALGCNGRLQKIV
jgi:hypothetical protein